MKIIKIVLVLALFLIALALGSQNQVVVTFNYLLAQGDFHLSTLLGESAGNVDRGDNEVFAGVFGLLRLFVFAGFISHLGQYLYTTAGGNVADNPG